MARTWKVGLIGTGGMMRHHLRTLAADTGLEIVALNDTDPHQLHMTREVGEAYVNLPAFDDYRAMLDSGVCDAVIIATPHTLHTQQILDSFAAGCHVLVEKPLTTSVADAHQVIKARDESGLTAGISYQRHGHGAFRWIRETIAAGTYGKVIALNSHLGQEWLKLTRGTWRQTMELSGGGQLNDSGSHMIDILLWVTGLRADKVCAFLDNCGVPVDINSVVNIRFEGGALGSLTVVGDAPLWNERHQIWLEKAVFFLEDDRLTIREDTGQRTVIDQWPPSLSPLKNFAQAMNGEAEVLAPFECGLRTIELTEAAWESGENGGAPTQVVKA